ncbi:hypothetical protein BT69DRAFT_1280160 [Atractiella rhizophila]|nr:hypothetical protein BT69DRAFT_1280160 [Atractiella rhizophila]
MAEFPLPEREYESWTCKEIYEYWLRGEIDLEPDYQREKVWTDGRERDLIDSIFRNIFIPAIVVSWNSEKGCWTIIDGKQRLSSVFAFFEGEIYWKKDKSAKKWYYTEPIEGLSSGSALLREQEKPIFDEYKFLIVRYTTLSIDQERVIFDRVQRGLVLTGGEKAASVGGPWGVWINQLSKKYTFSSSESPYGWAPRIANLKRGKQFIILAQIALHVKDGSVASHQGTESIKKLISEQKDEPEPTFRIKVERLLKKMDRLFRLPPPQRDAATTYEDGSRTLKTPHTVFTENKKLAPVEIIWMAFLIQHFDTMQDGELLEVIEGMRRAVNAAHPGNVKNNSTVSGYLKKWILTYNTSAMTYKYLNNGKFNPERGTKVGSRPAGNNEDTEEDELATSPQLSRAPLSTSTPTQVKKVNNTSIAHQNGVPTKMVKKIKSSSTLSNSTSNRVSDPAPNTSIASSSSQPKPRTSDPYPSNPALASLSSRPSASTKIVRTDPPTVDNQDEGFHTVRLTKATARPPKGMGPGSSKRKRMRENGSEVDDTSVSLPTKKRKDLKLGQALDLEFD